MPTDLTVAHIVKRTGMARRIFDVYLRSQCEAVTVLLLEIAEDICPSEAAGRPSGSGGSQRFHALAHRDIGTERVLGHFGRNGHRQIVGQGQHL